MAIGFVHDVQIPGQIPVVWCRFPQQIELENSGAGHVRMVRLRRPRGDEERLRAGTGNQVHDLVDHAAILDAPRRDHLGAVKVAVIQDVVEAVASEKPAPTGPFHVARRDEGGSIPSASQHRRQRRARKVRILLRQLPEIELRVRRQQHRDHRIGASTDVRVEIVRDHAPRRLRLQRRCRGIDRIVQTGPPRRHRLQDNEHDIRRPACGGSACVDRGGRATNHLRRQGGRLRLPRLRRIEVREIVWRVRPVHPDEATVGKRLPCRRGDRPMRAFGHAAIDARVERPSHTPDGPTATQNARIPVLAIPHARRGRRSHDASQSCHRGEVHAGNRDQAGDRRAASSNSPTDERTMRTSPMMASSGYVKNPPTMPNRMTLTTA